MGRVSSNRASVQSNSSKPKSSSLLSLQWESEHTGRLFVLLIVVVAFTLATLILVEMTGGVEKFRGLIEGAGPWAPVVYVLSKASTYVIAPLSGTTVKLASGALFGTWEGIALSLAGDTLGGALNYWIARGFGRKGVTKFAGKKALSQVDHATEKVANWRVLLGARLLLSSFYDFISYAAGLARISFTQYVVVTILGGVPISIIYAIMGNAAVESDSVSRVLIILSSIMLVAACAGYIYHKRQRSRAQNQTVAEAELES